MQIYFGENVRRLRREKNLTQEQLAAQLNVSFQTISNWERNENWPDISMLPVLASFFGVKTDDLLGVNQAEQEREIQELLDGFYTNAFINIGQWKFDEQKAKLKQLLKESPADYRLWALHFGLMTSLCPDDTAERVRARMPEVMSIYENIRDNCANISIRADVSGTMCHFLNRIIVDDPGNCAAERAAMEKIIGELPDLSSTRQAMSTYLEPVCQGPISDFLLHLNTMLCYLSQCLEQSSEEYRQILRCQIAVFDAIFPDGDYGRHYGYLSTTWQFLANSHARAGQLDEAFVAMRRVMELALQVDALPQLSKHTSPVFRDYEFDKPSCFSKAENSQGLRKVFSGELQGLFDWPKAFTQDTRFGEIMALLES